MLEFLKNYKGKVYINGQEWDRTSKLDLTGKVKIEIDPVKEQPKKQETHEKVPVEVASGKYRIKVKSYMTKKATPDFDFMTKWNNNVPMPLRVMVGEKLKETRGMVYVVLHGDILEERTLCCMKCGRQITNPVSQFFGMGPECGGHNYVHPFETDEELKQAVGDYKKQLRDLVWEGWIIKSAIEELEEV